MRALLVVVLCAGCHHHASHAVPTTGDITGLAWDQDSGNALAGVKVEIASRSGMSAPGGLFDVDKIPPGTYTLKGTFRGQTSLDKDLVIKAGDTTFAKLPFKLAHEDLKVVVEEPARLSEITRYHPANVGPTGAQIEGVVIDTLSHKTVEGAVINIVAADKSTQQMVSDEHGHYKFENVAPGTYAISAYYSVTSRGQIEVRRSDIPVAGGEAVVVPLLVELEK